MPCTTGRVDQLKLKLAGNRSLEVCTGGVHVYVLYWLVQIYNLSCYKLSYCEDG